MAGKVPFWVYEQQKSLMRSSHISETDRLRHRISQLEEENSDLKRKVAEIENVFLIALELLLKKH